MSCTAVVFDLDGTLLDTLQDLADAMNEVLQDRGYPVHPAEKYKYFVGDGVEMLVRRAVPVDVLPSDQVKALSEAFHASYSKRWDAKTTLYPGVDGLLTYLNQQSIPMAVLSNKPHDFTCLCVDRFLAPWSFAVVTGVTPGTPKKPDPTGALRIADELERPPGEILYVGDTNTDMETAKAAGMPSVGVLWGFRPEDELVRSGATWVAATPEEIVGLLK